MNSTDRRRKLTRGIIAALAGLALVAGGTLTAAPASATTRSHNVYASPTGIGILCIKVLPCSVTKAKTQARLFAALGYDVSVVLKDGTYRLTSPLAFSAPDGGQRGGSVTWKAASGATPVLTGATGVTGWSRVDSTSGVYVATVNSTFLTRQLTVNGRLAERARLVVPANSFTVTATGLTITDPAVAARLAGVAAAGVDFSATQSFTDRYSPVASIQGSTITMQQPAWDNNTYGYDTIQSPFRKYAYAFENSRSFLTEPGQWYFDSAGKKLYYKPLPGENMKTASVEIPRLENLMQISGTLAKPVAKLSFTGLTFTGTSWTGPNTTGLASQQTGAYISGVQSNRPADAFTSCAVGCAGFEATRGTWSQTPGAVQVSAARDIGFVGNTFRNLGSNALGIGNDGGANSSGVNLGAQGITVTGNVFTENAGAAANIGGTQKDAHHPSTPAMTNKNISVTNNVISKNALVYRDQSAVFASYVDGLTISHNDISEMPYTGIGIGYGWGIWDAGGSPDYRTRGTYNYYPVYSTPTTAKNNVVESNYLHGVMQVMADGACVYTLSAIPDSQINRNYCKDANNEYGIYNDEGSRYISGTDNVLTEVSAYFHINPQNGNLINNLRNTRTYSTTSRVDTVQGRDIAVVDPILIRGSLPTAAAKIAYEAGLEPAYRTSVDPDRSPVGVDVAASDSAPEPGDTFTVTAALTNVDAGQPVTVTGAALTGPTGWVVESSTPTAQVLAPGASANVSWTVRVPEDLTVPLPASFRVTVSSTLDATTFSDVRTLSVTPVIPPPPPITDTLSTFTDDGATFAQGAGVYSITGAGVDMFNGFGTVADDYGTIFKPQGAGTRSVVTARLVSYDSPANNSKASLVLRNDLTQPAQSTGYVSLAVQKDGGVTLFSDGNGDGYLERYQPAAGSPKTGPVYLRLVREDAAVTGFWSADGIVWNQVGSTVQLTSPTALLDAGFAYVSARPGTVGTATFDQFTITNG